MLGITQAKRVDALLPMIVSGLVERADFALARIWLIRSETPVADAEDEERFLRLSASAGSSREDGRLWNGLKGSLRAFESVRLRSATSRKAANHCIWMS